jgi:hypothetical protein
VSEVILIPTNPTAEGAGGPAQVEGIPVETSIPLPGSEDYIVLLDYMSGPKNFRNVVRIGTSGEVVWRAELPDRSGPESYVRLDLSSDGLIGHSWSGHRVVIEVGTGRIARSEFVK